MCRPVMGFARTNPCVNPAELAVYTPGSLGLRLRQRLELGERILPPHSRSLDQLQTVPELGEYARLHPTTGADEQHLVGFVA